jgi:hypothetical protein
MALRRRAHGCAHRADGTPKTESRELYEVKSWAREPRALALQEGSRGKIAGLTGLEPAAFHVTGGCSNQLSYNPIGQMHYQL